MKHVTIGQMLTEQQLQQAEKIFDDCKTPGKHGVHNLLLDELVQPNIAEINLKLGQENDARYLAYALENALHMRDKFRGELIKVMG